MLEQKHKVEELSLPVLEQHNAFLVEVQVRNERGGKMVQLFIDTDRGITIEQCAEVSRDLSKVFDDERLFDGNYQLEVSSPGIDRPLRLLRQYPKNIGRRFRVKFAGESEPQFMTATLISVVDDRLTFQPDQGEAITLEFERILESKEVLPW
jgi:ribosome maturation factor RimP